jgi:hypothetical protein
MRTVRAGGRIEQARKHGPFDPRFRRRPRTPHVWDARRVGPDGGGEHRGEGSERDLEAEAVRAWESEGGALSS